MRAAAALLAAVLATCALAACGGGEPRLTVLGASSLTEPLDAYGESFPGARVRTSLAGSDTLAAQIRRGAPADVFASADAELPRLLHREGLVGQPLAIASNRLVVAVPAGAESAPGSLADLAEPGTAIAVGDPSVPVGAYARVALSRLPAGERRAILANVRTEEPQVGSVVAKLLAGAADAGIVYRTDVVAAGPGLRAVPIPERLQPAIAYGAAVVAGSERPDLARAYLEGLTRGAGARDLRRAGFRPPP